MTFEGVGGEPCAVPSAPSADGLNGLPNARSGLPRHPGMLRHKTGGAAARFPSCAGTWQEPRAARREGSGTASVHWGC